MSGFAVPSVPTAAVAVDAGRAVSLSSAREGFVDVSQVTAPTPSAAVTGALGRVRSTDHAAIVAVGAHCVAVPLMVSADMLPQVKFTAAAIEELSIRVPEQVPSPAWVTGILANPSAASTGRLVPGCAVATAPPTPLKLWVPDSRRAAVWRVVPPAVAMSSMLAVLLFNSVTVVTSAVEGQPLVWLQNSTSAWAASAARLGDQGHSRLSAVLSTRHSDPVAEFEVRTVFEAAISLVQHARRLMQRSGFPCASPVQVYSGVGADVLVKKLTEEGIQAQPGMTPPGVSGQWASDPLVFAAAAAASATERFGVSVQMDNIGVL